MQTQRKYSLLSKVRRGESLLGVADSAEISELEPYLWRRTDLGPPARYALTPEGKAEFRRLLVLRRQETTP